MVQAMLESSDFTKMDPKSNVTRDTDTEKLLKLSDLTNGLKWRTTRRLDSASYQLAWNSVMERYK
ncbi:hypothetical protein Ocin01_12708 [Orchesella cincta]|uniref:Uncharacterized protein n=1 Tax=Orchesella cincta TaxID=48709 RepID=A0A1D2MMD7_ORCCI|nr:hypothetical protein Ocin01_12708 [Orchesella cincta]